MSAHDRTDERPPGSADVRGYAVLLCSEGGAASHLLPTPGDYVLGRDESCDISIDDSSVSRRHAVIHLGELPELEDLGSRNGTRVLGRRLAAGERVVVEIGTVVELGSTTLVFQRASAALVAHKPRKQPRSARSTEVVTMDASMHRLFGLLDVIAPSDLAVLVLGEAGVGKEVFAAEIHRRSPRANKRFLTLDCAAIPEPLLEAELFGHDGGVTGAAQSKPGLFEAADGGTVFLDEIAELSPSTQATLLRVLETGELVRVGSVTSRRVDVRLISATHRDLQACIAADRFRADLHVRLNGVTITIPPLRERLDDVIPLAEVFATRVSAVKPARFAPPAVAVLKRHSWPGNIRELRDVAERAVLFARGGRIEAEHIVIDGSAAAIAPDAPPTALREQVEDFERARICEALARANGHQGKAAELLGISRRALIDKLDAYDIERRPKRR